MNLFDSHERYTREACAINNELLDILRQSFIKYHNQGYSMRAIVGLMYAAVAEAGCTAVLDLVDTEEEKPDGTH